MIYILYYIIFNLKERCDFLDYQKLKQERALFYSQFQEFHADYGHEEYALYQTYKIDKKLEENIKEATNNLWNIFMKMKQYILTLSKEELEHLNIDDRLQRYLHLDYLTHHSFLSRMDFIVNPETNEVKMIELNNETPFYVVEAFQMNNAYLLHKEGTAQNREYLQNLINSFEQVLKDSQEFLGKEKPTIYILTCAENEDLEEFSLAWFYKNLFESVCPVELVHYLDLNIHQNEGVYDAHGNQIDVLFHPAYPIEFLQNDVSPENEPIGLWLLDLIEQRKLSFINSPTTHFMQNKTLLALLWTLHELKAPIFTEEEHGFIDKYFLPTYMNSFKFEMNDKAYVKKPVFGRNGASVEIYNNKQKLIVKNSETHLDYMNMIYQEYMEMPKVKIILEGREEEKKLMISSFIANGEYTGLVTVVGDDIIDDECHWLPNMII